MRRKFGETQTPSSVELKKDRKKISDSISVDKKNLEEISKATDKLKAEFKQSQKDLEDKKKEVEKVENILKQKNEALAMMDAKMTDKNQEFLSLDGDYNQKENELNNKMFLLEKELEEKISLKRNELEIIERQISVERSNLSDLLVRIKDRDEYDGILNNANISKEQTCAKLDLEIKEKEKSKVGLLKEIENLEVLAQNAKNLQEEIKNLAPQEIELLKKVREARKELENLDNVKILKMEDLNKKEKELNAREAGLNTRDGQSKENEKRIRTLGNTLQKHLDKQNIPIKVFE